MNIAVYLGSSEGNRTAFKEEAERLGRWIGASGHRLIYGGGRVGLMGILANSVLGAGGEVTGVIPEFLNVREVEHRGVTELHVVQTMSERKNLMMELGELFVAFPGGVGTLEEIAEVASRIRLKLLSGLCALYNLEGYYDPLVRQFDRMVEDGFLDPKARNQIRVICCVEEFAALVSEAERLKKEQIGI